MIDAKSQEKIKNMMKKQNLLSAKKEHIASNKSVRNLLSIPITMKSLKLSCATKDII